ncbi:MAG: DEAD/DEAH box helicase, partial [Dehalococcoidia bacterium]
HDVHTVPCHGLIQQATASIRRLPLMVASLARSFAEFRLIPPLAAAVARLGISTPTPIQSAVIPAMLEGRDIIGQARTGSGKTLAFAIPIVARCDPALRAVQALVLVPTRELAIQVGTVIGQLAEARRLRVMLLHGGRSLEPEKRTLAGGAQIVVGTPGRTLDHLHQGSLSLRHMHIFVLDEGDEMLDRGFGPDVERILSQAPAQRQTALLSATVPDWVSRTARRYLRNPITAHVDVELEAPPEIVHRVYAIDPARKLAALRTLLDRQGPDPIIVFGRTKHGVKKLATKLVELGYSVAALQGNMSQNARERVMADFRSGDVRVLMATNVAARGLDIDGVEQVINYELADSPELHTHRAGRTGRMGRAGETVTFITPEDAPKWREIERALGRRLPPVPWTGDTYPTMEPVREPQPQPRPRFSRPLPIAAVRSEPPRPPMRRAVPPSRGRVTSPGGNVDRHPSGANQGSGRSTYQSRPGSRTRP